MVETRRRKSGKQRSTSEQRDHPRYVVPGKVSGRQLTPRGLPKARKSVIQGRMENIGAGGLCLLTNDTIKVSYLFQCEITIAKTPAAIPTFTQVRWVEKNAKGAKYRVGLQFLL